MPALSGRQVALAATSGLLLTLSFPLPHFSTLAWIALVPLIVAAAQVSRGGACLLGWLTGVTWFTGTLHWLTNTMTDYGGLPLWVSYILLLLLTLYLGLYVGVFALGIRLLQARRGWVNLLTLPALWTALEYLRAHALTGFPWATLGYSQATTLPVIQIADLFGVYGVSFLIVFVNVAIAQALSALLPRAEMPLPIPVAGFAPLTSPPFPRQAVFLPLAAAVIVLNLALGYGHWRLDTLDHLPGTAPFTVTVVQGNIDQGQKWDPANLRATIERYHTLTRDHASPRPDLVVWPESAMPFFYEREPDYQRDLTALVAEVGTPLLFGSPALDAPTGQSFRLYNSAYVLLPEGIVAGRYDKLHLVPFGEYVPLAPLLFFVDKVVTGIGQFTPGAAPKVFDLDRARVGVMICFEVVFPDLVRRFVLDGATVMAAITNDAWFGYSAAPSQHFEMVVFRAVENRIPFARAANTGISGFIDASGRISNTTNLFVPAASTASLIPRADTPTFYTRHGDIFAWLCLVAAAGVLGWELTRGRTPASRGLGGTAQTGRGRMRSLDVHPEGGPRDH